MGAFFIAPNSRAASCDRLDRAHRQHGFLLSKTLRMGSHLLYLYRKLDGHGGYFIETGTNSFACLVGQLVYRGLSGEQALRRYCADLAHGSTDQERTIGHYALFLKDASGLSLQTDPFGFFHVYVNESAAIASSSFWALLELSPKVTVDAGGVYEYAWNGAPFGGKSFVREIRRLPAHTRLVIGEEIVPVKDATPRTAAISGRRLAIGPCLDEHAARLRRLFADLVAAFGERLQVSFSGGFDSRLVLAGLASAGLQPDLFVYGRPGNPDVEIAKKVAHGEKLNLHVIDKAEMADAGNTISPARHESDFILFDGWRVDGVFDDGSDARDRRLRHQDDRVPLNGSLGEIYRNFFYLPDQPMSLADVVRSFFSAYDPAACTGRFRSETYTAALVEAFQRELDCEDIRISRSQVESLYPLVRGRYWTGRDVNLNLRFGRMIFPFMQPQLIANTADLPLGFKNYGRLEGLLIERLNPAIAHYASGYGHRFSDPPPLRHRARSWFTMFRPPSVRRYSYRLRFAKPQSRPWFLDDAYLASVMDASMPYMRQYFHPARLHDPDAFNRVATMEYIFQRYAAED